MDVNERACSPAGNGDRLMRLECLRGAAALYVFLHHYVRINLPGHEGIAAFFPFGQAAVLVFFLLSGFVIHYASLGQRPELSFRQYFVRRARRIFPIFLIALLCTHVASSVYHGGWVSLPARELLLNLLQLQDRPREGNWAGPYLGNAPLWSLSYEWWFYMLYFPIERAFEKRPSWRRGGVLGISLLGFATDVLWPNPLAHVASYLVIWWSGVEVARQFLREGKVTLRQQAFSVGSILLLTALWGIMTVREAALSPLAWQEHPGLAFRHFATTFGLIAVGWLWYWLGLRGFDRLLGPFHRIAGFSYALYVMHLPLLWMARELGGTGLLAFLWVAPAVLGCCWWVEKVLVPWSQRSRSKVPPVLRGEGRPA
ncbi:MAG: hypothetical protein RL685_5075 [Pseudomonadota bacterium]|jgi:peptidoglycan/LPS O-acetylase OafA/YrhL